MGRGRARVRYHMGASLWTFQKHTSARRPQGISRIHWRDYISSGLGRPQDPPGVIEKSSREKDTWNILVNLLPLWPDFINVKDNEWRNECCDMSKWNSFHRMSGKLIIWLRLTLHTMMILYFYIFLYFIFLLMSSDGENGHNQTENETSWILKDPWKVTQRSKV